MWVGWNVDDANVLVTASSSSVLEYNFIPQAGLDEVDDEGEGREGERESRRES